MTRTLYLGEEGPRTHIHMARRLRYGFGLADSEDPVLSVHVASRFRRGAPVRGVIVHRKPEALRAEFLRDLYTDRARPDRARVHPSQAPRRIYLPVDPKTRRVPEWTSQIEQYLEQHRPVWNAAREAAERRERELRALAEIRMHRQVDSAPTVPDAIRGALTMAGLMDDESWWLWSAFDAVAPTIVLLRELPPWDDYLEQRLHKDERSASIAGASLT